MRRLKWLLQKVFRKHHTSDLELWNINYYLAKYIHKKLVAFKKAKRVGYPYYYIEYDKNIWESKKRYNDLIKSGELIGGGLEAWEKSIDEMIYGFEWLIADGNGDKAMQKFCKKYNLGDSWKDFHKGYDRAEKGVAIFGRDFFGLWD